MAWNEPGGNKDKDPWGNKNNQDGPPDLDEIVKKMQKKLKGVLGGKGPSTPSADDEGSGFLIGFIAVLALLIWGSSGFYIVDEQEKAIVLQFGEFKEETLPGWHWRFPTPIEKEYKVNVTQVQRYNHEYQMLTGDENIIYIKLEVQFRIDNAQNFLFEVSDPLVTLEEVTESALRTVVGHRTMDDVLDKSDGRQQLITNTTSEVQGMLNEYKTGMTVVSVNLQNARPPREIDEAVIDVQKAKEDQDKYKKQGQAYFNDVIPKAEGLARSLKEHALAYKLEKIAAANGDTSRFLQTYEEYRKAPDVTRKRLYIETMESVLSKSSKVMVKINQGSNIMYIPLQQILDSAHKGADGSQVPVSAVTPSSSPQTAPRYNFNPSDRGGR